MATWVGFCLALWALTMATLILGLLRAKTNSSAIYTNQAFCLLVAETLYLVALKARSALVTHEVNARIMFCCWKVVRNHQSGLVRVCGYRLSTVSAHGLQFGCVTVSDYRSSPVSVSGSQSGRVNVPLCLLIYRSINQLPLVSTVIFPFGSNFWLPHIRGAEK